MRALILYFLLLLFISINNNYAQEDDSILSVANHVKYETLPSIEYRPGINYQNAVINENVSRQNLIDSPAIRVESGNIGRFGNIRVDGAATKPMLGIDGFVIRDPSINEGQMLLDMLPYDFANKVDIYKQNLSPFGINTGSFVDFRIPVKYQDFISLDLKGTTIGGLYTKMQGEKTFKNGSTVYGIVGDFGFMDYYYGVDGGRKFKFYKGSQYKRVAILSKTVWHNLEFLFADTFYNGYNEGGGDAPPSCELTRNNLIIGLRYQTNIIKFSANYTFLNQYVKPYHSPHPPSIGWNPAINDYLNHNFTTSIGVGDSIGRYSYNIALGYENRSVHDGMRAVRSNYSAAPKFGENDFNVLTEFTVSTHKKKEQPRTKADFHLSMNQILTSTGYYTPIPSFSLDVQHKNRLYFSADVSRVYIIPDITSSYGFGQNSSTQLSPSLLPKDGIRTGLGIAYTENLWRVYANASYAWLNASFRVNNKNMVENIFNVTAISTELGAEYKQIVNALILTYKLGVAMNFEVDKLGNYPTPIPLWKMVSSFSIRSIDNIWLTTLIYRLETCIPYGGGKVDTLPRHFLDLNIKYKMLIFNILNLLNQSYLPQPENIYSPVNPGVRAELGLQFEF